MAADLLQHWLPHRLAQRRVIGTRRDLDHAARDHLARTRAAARGITVKIDPIAGLKPAESGSEIEFGIGQLGPTRQRPAVLDFLLAPAARALLEIRVVMENPAQMVGIVAAIVFDEAPRLDDPHDLRIELAAVEASPVNIIERPGAHAAPPLCCLSRLSR